MKCEYSKCGIEFPDTTNRNGEPKRFCNAQHQLQAWKEKCLIRRKHPKRQRDRKRERLMRELFKGFSLSEIEQMDRAYIRRLLAKMIAREAALE